MRAGPSSHHGDHAVRVHRTALDPVWRPLARRDPVGAARVPSAARGPADDQSGAPSDERVAIHPGHRAGDVHRLRAAVATPLRGPRSDADRDFAGAAGAAAVDAVALPRLAAPPRGAANRDNPGDHATPGVGGAMAPRVLIPSRTSPRLPSNCLAIVAPVKDR